MIATIDMSSFLVNEGCVVGEHPTTSQQQVAETVDRVMRAEGTFYVTGFGISDGEVEEMLQVARTFFKATALPKFDPIKNMGHSSLRKENLNPNRHGGDLKESFTIKAPDRFVNDYGDAPEEHASRVREFFEKLTHISERFMMVCALALGLPTSELDFFQREHANKDSIVMRLNHYPPCEFRKGSTDGKNGTGAVRIGEHADFGMFTFLFLEHGASGLQVKRPAQDSSLSEEARWVEVPGRGGACAVVNCGKALSRWTNDRWHPTVHRVVVNTQEEALKHRYSIPFFVQPDSAGVIAPHPAFLAPGESAVYAPISADAHLKMLLQQMMCN